MTTSGRLDYFDQTGFELLRSTGRGQLIQGVWIYRHPIDFEALGRFHRNLGAGLLGRLIERSPLPFSRPRWVSRTGPHAPLIVEDKPRHRSEVMAWANEFATRPIDPEAGPGWLLGVLPLTDGATAVSLVCSHCLVDGGGSMFAVWDAVAGTLRDFGYPPPRSRTAVVAVGEDLLSSVREIPQLVSSLGRVAGYALRNRRGRRQPPAAQPAESGEAAIDEIIVEVPSVVAFVETGRWDAKAESLGGNTFSLFAGFTAKIAEHLGRRHRADGTVTLVIAGSDREGLDDDRALAMSFATVGVHPEGLSVDLTESRNAIRVAREKAKSEPDPATAILPIVPWFPQRMARAFVAQMFAYDEALPVSCSNMGDLPPEIACPDGTPADLFFARSVDQKVTLRDLKRSNGILVVVSGRINGRIFISVEAYQLDAQNSASALRDVMEQTLADFGLDAEII